MQVASIKLPNPKDTGTKASHKFSKETQEINDGLVSKKDGGNQTQSQILNGKNTPIDQSLTTAENQNLRHSSLNQSDEPMSVEDLMKVNSQHQPGHTDVNSYRFTSEKDTTSIRMNTSTVGGTFPMKKWSTNL